MTTAKEILPITAKPVHGLASQRSAHARRVPNRPSCILTRGPNRSKAATVTGRSSELAQGREDERKVDRALGRAERRVGETMDDMSSIYDNEKRNPPIFWSCAEDTKEKNTYKIQREVESPIWSILMV
jgi:hypothetical protein